MQVGLPPAFMAYMLKIGDGEAIELRTWRWGAQFTKSHRIWLNSNGYIKETKSSMGLVRCCPRSE